MKKALLFVTFTPWLISSLLAQKDKKPAAAAETRIKIETTMGNIVVKLYDDTPFHKTNFLNLINKKFYDSTLFHRVINSFMIQGGDPDSKKAAYGVMLGEGGTGYTVPAEIMPEKHCHKKGALAAARMGDDVNPNKESSGCQFYIVQGKQFTAEDLVNVEARINNGRRNDLFNQFLNKPQNLNIKMKVFEFQRNRMTDSLMALYKKIEPLMLVEQEHFKEFKFNEQQKQTYMTVGGTPHLDGGYTVFGEVVEGLEVIDLIAATKTNQYDRPETDVRILKMTILDK